MQRILSVGGSSLVLFALASGACDPLENKPRPAVVSDAGDAGVPPSDPRWPNWPLPPDSPPATEYVIEGGVVHDSVTNLDWAQYPSAPALYQEAEGYCQRLTLGGLAWRLPTRIELVSILDLSPKVVKRVYAPGFVEKGDFEVSSSPVEYDASKHWGVSFGANTLDVADPAAIVFFAFPDAKVAARCVHDPRGTTIGVGPRPSYSVRAGYLVDSQTGLAFQAPVPEPSKATVVTQDAAAKACAALSLGPWTDGWRLASAKELYSVIDETRSAPALDPAFGVSRDPIAVWSSLPGRRIDLFLGGTYEPGDPYGGWCVHAP